MSPLPVMLRCLMFFLFLFLGVGASSTAMASEGDSTERQPALAPTYEQLLLLDRQIERVDEEMPSLGLPVTLTAVGFGIGAMGLAGYSASCSLSCSGGVLAAAIGGMTLGLGGAVFTTFRVIKRRPYKRKINALEERREALELRLEAVPLGGMAGLSYQF